jgi:hypothetical protein
MSPVRSRTHQQLPGGHRVPLLAGAKCWHLPSIQFPRHRIVAHIPRCPNFSNDRRRGARTRGLADTMCDNAPSALPLGRETGFAKVRRHLVAEGKLHLDSPAAPVVRCGARRGTPLKTWRVLAGCANGFPAVTVLHALESQAAHTGTRAMKNRAALYWNIAARDEQRPRIHQTSGSGKIC